MEKIVKNQDQNVACEKKTIARKQNCFQNIFFLTLYLKLERKHAAEPLDFALNLIHFLGDKKHSSNWTSNFIKIFDQIFA